MHRNNHLHVRWCSGSCLHCNLKWWSHILCWLMIKLLAFTTFECVGLFLQLVHAGALKIIHRTCQQYAVSIIVSFWLCRDFILSKIWLIMSVMIILWIGRSVYAPMVNFIHNKIAKRLVGLALTTLIWNFGVNPAREHYVLANCKSWCMLTEYPFHGQLDLKLKNSTHLKWSREPWFGLLAYKRESLCAPREMQ